MWESNIFDTIGEATDWLNENKNHITNVSVAYNNANDWYVIFYFDTDFVNEGV